MQVLLTRIPQGFVPSDDEAREDLKHFPVGSVAKLEVKLMRNSRFFRKWWALAKLGFDYFEGACGTLEFRGQPVQADFERFRKDLIIMAGFYRPVWNLKGEMRIEHESISWASMDEKRFEKLYDATIRVLLEKVFNGERVKKWSEQELRSVCEQIEAFQ